MFAKHERQYINLKRTTFSFTTTITTCSTTIHMLKQRLRAKSNKYIAVAFECWMQLQIILDDFFILELEVAVTAQSGNTDLTIEDINNQRMVQPLPAIIRGWYNLSRR
jgi:hypothetical protein